MLRFTSLRNDGGVARIPSSAPFLISRLRELRKAAGLSQEQFAEISCIDYKVYQHIEAGRRKNLQLKTLDRLAWAYGITIFQLFSQELPEFQLRVPPRIRIPKKRGRKKGSRNSRKR